jgi:hypothetical protein
LKWILFDTGISSLVDKDALQDTHYKQLRFSLHKEDAQLKLNLQVSYAVETRGDHTFKKVTAAQTDSLRKCLICAQSAIQVAQPNGWLTIYDLQSASAETQLDSLAQADFWAQNIIEMAPKALSSERYVSDFSFSKDAIFHHRLTNSES